MSPINAVVVPALSRLQAQPERYRRFYLQVFEALAIGGFLFTGLLLPLARPLTITLLGVRWEAAAAIFAGLAVAAVYIPLFAATTLLYNSQGRGRDSLRMHLIVVGVAITSTLIGLPFGPVGVAIASSMAGVVVQLPFAFYFAGRSGPVSVRDLWVAYLRHLPVLVVVGCTTWIAYTLAASLSPVKQLFLCGPVGILVGCATLFLSPHSRRVSMSFFEALKSRRKS
jgi:PST family polysaccharide transporter